MRAFLQVAGVALLCVTIHAPASAIVYPDGDPVEGGSWSTNWIWTNDGLAPMDELHFDIIPSSGSQDFIAPWASAITGGYSLAVGTPTHIELSGPSLAVGASFDFTQHFAAATVAAEPIHYFMTSFSGGALNEKFLVTRDSSFTTGLFFLGNGWYGRTEVIPEPTTLGILGLALAGAGLLRRRRRV